MAQEAITGSKVGVSVRVRVRVTVTATVTVTVTVTLRDRSFCVGSKLCSRLQDSNPVRCFS